MKDGSDRDAERSDAVVTPIPSLFRQWSDTAGGTMGTDRRTVPA
jgi:hypothetical protein